MRKKFRQVLYEIFSEYKDLPKIEIVKIAAEKADVSVSKIWHELEKRKIFTENNSEIIEALKYKERKTGKNSQSIALQKNIETIVKNTDAELVTETTVPEDKRNQDSPRILTKLTKPKKPSKEILEDLYIKRSWDTKKIAQRYQRGRGTIYVWLREYGIPRHIVSTKRPRSLGRLSKEVLYNEYVENKKTIEEISKIHLAGKTTIRRWLKEYGIQLRTASEELLKNRRLPIREELEELYINKQISMKRIAEMYKTGTRIIKRLLKNFEIPVRNSEDALSLAALKGKKVPSEGELVELYFNKGKSIDEIAKAYGISKMPILRLFKKYNLKTRTLKQANKLRIKKEKQANLEKFEAEKYNGLKGLVGLFGQALEDDEAKETIDGITSNYLYKLKNLYETLGEGAIENEILLIAEHDKNKLEPLLLKCLYRAVLITRLNPTEIYEGSGEFEILQRIFFKEIRKLYIRYTIEKKNNISTNSLS